ncbi:unnamed protein product [Lymnaea stagnalis]|uniref:Sema domain-containing protein n=1 Tax=Lymnaea stagnalis TaxID=6523 RepID=A0AAV2HE13_LYMST
MMTAPRKPRIWLPQHRYLIGILVAAVFLGTARCNLDRKPGSLYLVAEFTSNTTFNRMAISEANQDVYIGAVNYLYHLDKNLNKKAEVVTGPLCYTCPDENKMMNTVNKLLVIDLFNQRLLVCGTVPNKVCEKRHLDNISVLDPVKHDLNSPLNALITLNGSANTVAYIAPGPSPSPGEPQSMVLYVGESWTPPKEIPSFSIRNLTTFNLYFFDDFFSSSFALEGQFHTYLISYIYGFDSQNFSYMMTSIKNQLDSQSKIVSYLVRVCQKDKVFYSHTEVPFNCTHGNVQYNVLKAGYLSKPGRNLALSLNINTQMDVLFGLFTTERSASSGGKDETALCIFPMNYIRKKFTENIQLCHNGVGQSGGGHLMTANLCYKSMINIDDDFCGTDTHRPILGKLPLESTAVQVFSRGPQLDVMAVGVTGDYTVGFIGASDGSVYKLSFEANSTANLYEVVSVAPNNSFKLDISFDEDGNHLYLLTHTKVIKMKVHNCSQYKTCFQCQAAKDPYCGWCSIENRCSDKSNCSDNEQPKRWLPYDNQECPKIKKIIPSEIPIDKERLLTLDIQNMPDLLTPSGYQCQFSQWVNAGPPQVITVPASRSANNFQCYTPNKYQLPAFETGRDSVSMNLSLLMNNMEVVKEKVAFFNCANHTSCTACTMSEFPCSWCIKKHMCSDNTDQHCQGDTLITGQKKPGKSDTPGPEFCPKFENMEPGTEILVAAGSTRSIAVRGVSLFDFQRDSLWCDFRADDIHTVQATIKEDQGRVFTITCNEFQFTYLKELSRQNFVLTIHWGDGKHLIDNPKGVQVVAYKCSNMATTCGACLMIEEKYKCGWCGDNLCTTELFCKNKPSFLREKVCKNPKIKEFYPLVGPVAGGTSLTIIGENFVAENNESIKVIIGNGECNVTYFKAPDRIECKTKGMKTVYHHTLTVNLDPQAVAHSADMFAFVQPEIMEISPKIGPYDGGTRVTLRGSNLDAGSTISVHMDNDIPCVDIQRLNTTAISCKTSKVDDTKTARVGVSLKIDDAVLTLNDVFHYVQNPNITSISRMMSIRSGGLLVNVSGHHLNNVQSPRMLIWYNGVAYSGPCNFTATPSTNITCITPLISGLNPYFESFQDLEFGFKMDNVTSLEKLSHLGRIKIYPDPTIEPYSNKEKVHKQSQDFLLINCDNSIPLKQYDIKVTIGQEVCNVISVSNSVTDAIITCALPPSQPPAKDGSGSPEIIVHIGQNLTFDLGVLRYEKQEGLTKEAMITIGVVVAASLLVCLGLCIYCLLKFRRNDDLMKRMRKEMDQLESRVANECKEAFTELQTDMTELTSDLSGGSSIPFWDYRTYCMRVLFPPECNDHPVIRELELDYRNREDTERGLKLFFNLIRNKTFLLIFVRTLEGNPDFTMKDRVNVASLISVSLQTQMEYATEILKTLLAELIEKTVENPKVHPKLLLRRNESVAEKMLTNWYTFLLYKFLKECAGEPLFMLYGAIKQQVSKGPVDSITSEARYSLSEDKLIRQHVNYKPMVLHVMDVDVDRCSQPAHPVKVLDCDTISQVKEKILDSIYKSAPYSSRPPKEELDLVLFDHLPEWLGDRTQIPLKMFPNKDTKRLVLSDDDHTTKSEGDCRRLNTLSHYKVPDGAYVALHPKQMSMYNMSFIPEKSSKFGSENSFYSQSPSLNRSLSPQHGNNETDGKYYHLVRHQDIESNNKEGERGSKMVSEIYLPRLLVTKGTLQTFVDDLFERIFSTAHRGSALPLAIKYMFDFLDDQALHHSMNDEVVHTWKSNSLPLRFWVNVIKNPNFAFDIYKSNIVDACLTVIGQTFMDCCSTLEHKLTKDSPSGKLLYAKDIPKYKQWVSRYYQDIKIMPAISDQDMTAMLAEESRTHQNEFNTNAALLELYKYVKKYYDDIVNALEDDEFAKKSKLTYKLDQVSAAMDGNTIC